MKLQAHLAASAAALTILAASSASANELEPATPDRIVTTFPAPAGHQRSVEIVALEGQPIRVSFVCGKTTGGVDLQPRREGWVPVGALLDLEYDRPCSGYVAVNVLFEDRLASDFDRAVKVIRLDFLDGGYVGWAWDGDNGLPSPPRAPRSGS